MKRSAEVRRVKSESRRPRSCFQGLWCVALFAIVFNAAPGGATARKNALLNKPAPSFSMTSLQNERVDLGALRGRVVLLNFWATWCGPCQVEMPRFVEWQERYKSEGLSVLGVSMDDDSDPVRSFLRKRKLNYPIVMGDEKLGLAYGGVLGLPITYLIDRQGIIRARYQGETNLDVVEKAVRRLLQVQ